MARETRIAQLTRVKTDPTAPDARTLFFTFPRMGRAKAAADFIRPQYVPEFEGEQAWFELQKAPAREGGHWVALRRVDGPGGGGF